MKQLLLLITTTFFGTLLTFAQTPQTPVPTAQAYGKIDKADLELKTCDFEKDANAEILFSKGSVDFDPEYNLIFELHERIKIFNDNGKEEANIKFRYFGGHNLEYVLGVQAQTINLNNGAIEITKVDKKQIFYQRVDKLRNDITFAFPNVKAGSVLEYKLTISTPYFNYFPNWYFQQHLPVRYSEFDTKIPYFLYYKNLVMINQPLIKNTAEIKSMVNIPSLNKEPYMSSIKDNAQRILYQLQNVNLPGYVRTYSDSWQKVGEEFVEYDDFGEQIKRKLNGEEELIAKAKGLGSEKEKIAYLFNEVKNQMKWNESDIQFTDDGTSEAWKKKTGNSTEINLILNHLLQKSGVRSLPLLVSTKSNGKINPAYPNGNQFNKTVAYIPIDSTDYYVLDATSKFNTYNEIPRSLLNGFGLLIDKEAKKHDLIFVQRLKPVRDVSLINAEIKPDGKMTGTIQLNSFSYNRMDDLEDYKTDGEEKYIKSLENGDNNLKISNLKFENMEIDTLPLTQSFNFSLDLSGSDENYIYFQPNLFADEYSKDFLNEHRYTDIDFGFMTTKTVNGSYKIPAGFKMEGLPKSISMSLPGNSIIFKRLVAEQEGTVIVRYTLIFKKPLFFKEDYADFHEFFKKMNELLNEQVVLKKI